MIPVQIIGHAGSGKTTLMVDLIKNLTQKNIRVGTMKHSAHVHELDKPGKDSFRHRIAGAGPVAMVTEELSAIYLPRTPDTSPEKILTTFYSHVDIILIEGWIKGPFPKIEVYRNIIDKPPLFTEIKCVRALVSDDFSEKMRLPVFPRADIASLTDFVLTLAGS